MNVSAAPAPPASPVADGSVTAAGQADAPATGFDALLALVDAAAAGAANDGAPPAPDAAPSDTTDPAAGPSDAMMAALAAMMIPAAPLADTIVAVADAPGPAAPAGPAIAADVAPTAPLFSPPEAAADAAPVSLPKAADTAQAEIAALPPLAAPTTTKTEVTAPAPATPATATPMAATPMAATPVARDSARSEAPARPATAPVGGSDAKPAAEAVKTQTADAVAAIAGGAGKDAADPGLAQAETAVPPPAGAPAATDAASTPAPVRTADTLAPVAEAVAIVRGSPDTVAKLSADILKKLDGRSTRFEIALDPLGLGRVDVKMEIGANGHVTANLSFDTAHAASELRNRSGELRHALQQAGFDLPENALSFDVNSQAGGDGRGAQTAWDFEGRGQGRNGAFAGRAFEAVMAGGESLISDLSTRFGAPRADGVDVRI